MFSQEGNLAIVLRINPALFNRPMNLPARFISIYGIFSLTLGSVSGDVVINEIHFNPPDNTVRQEFIEIHNPDAAAINLGGWRISGAVDYYFPAGISIAGGDYLVIAEDPSTLLETLNVTALGPYNGSLDSEGETIRLRDASDQLVDMVDYKAGFPWPVASNGGGASIELMNAGLDNSLGSSWRASLPQNLLSEAILLPFADDGWSWRPGNTEASEPVEAWRAPGFIEDETWSKGARAPFGFGRVKWAWQGLGLGSRPSRQPTPSSRCLHDSPRWPLGMQSRAPAATYSGRPACHATTSRA